MDMIFSLIACMTIATWALGAAMGGLRLAVAAAAANKKLVSQANQWTKKRVIDEPSEAEELSSKCHREEHTGGTLGVLSMYAGEPPIREEAGSGEEATG